MEHLLSHLSIYLGLCGAFAVGFVSHSLLSHAAQNTHRASVEDDFEAIMAHVRAGTTTPSDELRLREILLDVEYDRLGC